MNESEYEDLINGNLQKVIDDYFEDKNHTVEDCTLVTVLYTYVLKLVAEVGGLNLEVQLLTKALEEASEEKVKKSSYS